MSLPATTHQPKCGGFGGLTGFVYICFQGQRDRETRRETRTQAMCGPLAEIGSLHNEL